MKVRHGLAVVEKIRKERAQVKRQLLELYGPYCENCERPSDSLALHEVFTRRSAIPVFKQLEIHCLGNCALVCIDCHEIETNSQEFKDRIARKRRAMNIEPYERMRK